jgi:iron complex outermembrane receptor protein
LWAAISRAARIPTRFERDIAVDATDPNGNPLVRLIGNEDFDAEELLAYELGYRWRPTTGVIAGFSGFYNRYDGLSSLEFGSPYVDSSGRTILPILNRNLTDGETHGVETGIAFAPTRQWQISANYSYIHMELDPRGADLNRGEFREGATPQHQVNISSYLDLPRNVQVAAQWRHQSNIRQLPEIATGEGIPAYSELSMRVAWSAFTWPLEIALVGHNLLHRRHAEFGSPTARGEMERSVYLEARWGR